jgi:hypothetical protein
MQFRKLMRKVMSLKGLTYADVSDALARRDENYDEQMLRNWLKLGSRPILAPDARAIWQAVAIIPSHCGFDCNRDGDQELLRALWPRPAWMERYEIRQRGPGVIVPPGEVQAFAEMIAANVARTRVARRAAQRKIVALLQDERVKMSSRWRDLAEEHAVVIAASASRGEYIWQDRLTGKDVIRKTLRTPQNPYDHDVLIVKETIGLLAGDARGLRANKKCRTNPREVTTTNDGKTRVAHDDARAGWEPFMPPGSAEADPLRPERRN